MSTPPKRGMIERIGSALPESNLLFLILIGLIIVASFFAKGSHPSALDGAENYTVNNLLSIEGFRWIIANVLRHFTNYPPLALIVVGVIGFGFAEKTGLLSTLIKVVGHSTSEKMILPMIIFLGISSSIAADAGYIVLVPLAGALYAGLGRNPLIGILAAFAAVSAGFGASLVPTPGDGMLGAMTAHVYENSFNQPLQVNIMTMAYFFTATSTIFLTIFLTFVTKVFVEKRINRYDFTLPEDIVSIGALSAEEKKGLYHAGIAFVITLAVIIFAWHIGILHSYTDVNDRVVHPILQDIIVLLILLFLFPALAYARAMKTINNGQEYINTTVSAMRDVAYILVFATFAGNFLGIFNYSGLDKFVANKGAMFLLGLNIQNPILLAVTFVFISAFINLFMGSAGAKWAILAPIFVPMLVIASHHNLGPEVIQAAYRIGDSATNIITPLMVFTGVILVGARRYNNKFEIGDLIALMMPYSIAILLGWTVFFVLWLVIGIPFGF